MLRQHNSCPEGPMILSLLLMVYSICSYWKQKEMQRKGRRKSNIYYHYTCQGEEDTATLFLFCLSKTGELPLSQADKSSDFHQL